VSNRAVEHATDVVPRQQLVVADTALPPVRVNVARTADLTARTGSPKATTTGPVRAAGAAIAGLGASVSTVHVLVAGALVDDPAVAVTMNVCLP